jgi:hypothetical protein
MLAAEEGRGCAELVTVKFKRFTFGGGGLTPHILMLCLSARSVHITKNLLDVIPNVCTVLMNALNSNLFPQSVLRLAMGWTAERWDFKYRWGQGFLTTSSKPAVGHTRPHTMGTGGYFLGGKAAAA